jgi:hypothetical protein
MFANHIFAPQENGQTMMVEAENKRSNLTTSVSELDYLPLYITADYVCIK